FGGIAKGYGADRAAEILRKYGYEYGYVNLGLSSLRLLKRNVSDKGALERNMWAIGMPNPDNRTEDFLSIFGKDTGVSTSGTYDLRYSIGGREYSHMIDPKTGEPTRSDIVSVTVLGKNAAYDDALSTALCIMGAEKAKAFIRDRMEGYRVMCLIKNGERLETFTNMKAGDFAINSPH
ncbi:MAG: FAD:protein FMN transferase, partial [Treponemataceae bacterium]